MMKRSLFDKITRLKIGRRVRNIPTYLILMLFIVVTLYPLVWLVSGSFKTRGEFYVASWGLPQDPVIDNYNKVWDAGIGPGMKNTLISSLGSVIMVIVVASLAGYAFAKIRFPGSNVVFAAALLTMMISPVYTVVSIFRIEKALGIINTYFGLIVVYATGSLPVALALFTTYFRQMPQDLDDAAMMDGATWLQILMKIVIPLSGPAIAAVAIFTFLGAYNDLFLATILMGSNRTLTATLSQLVFIFESNFPLTLAGVTTSLLPVFIFYLFFQRYFVRGLMAGAVKG